MAVFKSQPVEISAPAETVFDRLSDLDSLKTILANVPADKIPADQKEMFDAVRITSDSISFPAGPVGELTLKLHEKIRPTLISLVGEGTPVALTLSLNMFPISPDQTEGVVSVDIAIPAMLKPMVSGPLQKMVDQFATMLPAVARQ